MHTMSLVDEKEHQPLEHQFIEKPGAQLAFIREKRGFTVEYVAGKLHLRKRIIELLEADVYDQLPQAVFVKGYIRAYAKFLNLDAEPLITLFSNACVEEHKQERTLWQTRREPNRHERVVRWVTGLIVLVAVLALTFWWQKNKNFVANDAHNSKNAKAPILQHSSETDLTEVSTIQSLFGPDDKTKPEQNSD